MIAAFACAVLAAAPVLPVPVPADGTVEVRVVSADLPRPGAVVDDARVVVRRVVGAGPFDPDRLLGGEGVPAPAGVVRLPDPAGEGRLIAVAVAPGRAPGLAWVPADGAAAVLHLRTAAALRVQVLRPSGTSGGLLRGGIAVPGATVEWRPSDGFVDPGGPPLVRRATTDAEGVAAVADADRGPLWDAAVQVGGHAPGTVRFLRAGGSRGTIVLVPAGRVRGRVVRVPDGEAVAGAVVRAGEQRAVTDASGGFVLTDLAPRSWTLMVEAHDAVALDRPVVLPEAGRTIDVGTLRVGQPVTLAVRTVTAAGEPVGGVVVTWLPGPGTPGGAAGRTAVTGSDGTARIDGVVPGSGHRLLLDAPEPWAPRLTEGFATAWGRSADLGLVVLDRGGRVTGRVLDVDGRGLPEATVTIFDGRIDPLRVAADPAAGGPLRRTVRTDADGRFTFTRVPAGARRVLAGAPGRRPTASSVLAVETGEVADAGDLRPLPGATVTGRLRDADGAPIAGALLLAARLPGGGEPAEARTADDGSFRLEGLAAGGYRLRIQLPGETAPDPARPERFVVAPTRDFEVRLLPRWVLTGRVVDPRGDAVAGNLVVARLEGEPGGGPLFERAVALSEEPLEADGAWTTGALFPGRYRLRVDARDGRTAVQDVVVRDSGPPDELVLTLRPGARIRGLVVDGVAGGAIEGVPVVLRVGGREEAVVPPALSGPDGVFVLSGVPAGEHALIARFPGRSPAVLHGLVVPEGGGVVDVGELRLDRGVLLRVEVRDERRAPSAGVAVTLLDADGGRREATTAAGGLVVFGAVPAGAHLLELRLPSGAVMRRPVEVPDDVSEQEEVFDLGLDAPGTVRVLRAGVPVAGAVVRVRAAALGPGAYAASVEVAADAAGLARVPALPEGPVVLEVTPPGEPAVHLAVDVRGRFVDVDLPDDGLAGRVEAEESGAAVPGAVVTAYARSSGGGTEAAVLEGGVETTAGPDGRFVFPSLAPGNWVLEVAAPGRGAVRAGPFRVLAGGGATPAEVRLPAAARLAGVVLGPSGAPVPGARIEVVDPFDGRPVPGGRGVAGPGGRWALDGLAAGRWTVTARSGALGASPPESVSLAPGERRAVTLHLLPGGTLEVLVLGPGGVPVGDVRVTVEDVFGNAVPPPEPRLAPGAPLLRRGRTGPDGLLRFPGLRVGVYLVAARGAGLEPGEGRVRVDAEHGARTVVVLREPPRTDE